MNYCLLVLSFYALELLIVIYITKQLLHIRRSNETVKSLFLSLSLSRSAFLSSPLFLSARPLAAFLFIAGRRVPLFSHISPGKKRENDTPGWGLFMALFPPRTRLQRKRGCRIKNISCWMERAGNPEPVMYRLDDFQGRHDDAPIQQLRSAFHFSRCNHYRTSIKRFCNSARTNCSKTLHRVNAASLKTVTPSIEYYVQTIKCMNELHIRNDDKFAISRLSDPSKIWNQYLS